MSFAFLQSKLAPPLIHSQSSQNLSYALPITNAGFQPCKLGFNPFVFIFSCRKVS